MDTRIRGAIGLAPAVAAGIVAGAIGAAVTALGLVRRQPSA